ncbi:MAG: M36 family metallopeptidase [Ignavibacteriae bacterium]|nr:M36 family metallopeptidase [Ignavibacteriota bacterium]
MKLKLYLVTILSSFLLGSLSNFHAETLYKTKNQQWHYTTKGRWDLGTDIPRALYHVNYGPLNGTPEQVARMYLQDHQALFRMMDGLPDLHTQAIQKSPAGQHVRFIQTYQGIPIYRSDVVVSITRNNVVTFVSNNYKPGVVVPSTLPHFDRVAAVQKAETYLQIKGPILGEETAALMVFAEDSVPRLSYKVNISTTDPRGSWEIFLDAQTGEVLQSTDIAVYEEKQFKTTPSEVHTQARVDGSGYVFNPDPLTTAGAFYGSTGYTDNNDADSPQLNAQRVLVTLKDISFDGSTYRLIGPYVYIDDWDVPNIPPVTATHPDSFRFTRSQDGFEDVNLYFQIDSSQRYIQSLGFTNIQNLSLRADPHGLNGLDNAQYNPSLNAVTFGDGGTDDAEDADVIWHEYGHAIQWGTVPGWGGGEEGALGEGFSDYWGGSYSRTINPTFSRNFFATWDAGFNGSTGRIWSGRPLNDPRIYPDTGVASLEVHDAGQIWASVLMSLWDDLGRDVMDKLVLQSHYYMSSIGTMRDNAAAIIQADADLFGGAHETMLLTRFFERNFLAKPQISDIPHRDTEDLAGPYRIDATITAGYFPLDEANLKLIWGRNGDFTDTLILQSSGILDQYTASIPGDGSEATYQYYIVAYDNFGNAVTDPRTAPSSLYSFYAGVDTVDPVVTFTPLFDHAVIDWPPSIQVIASDNIGINSVWVDYVRQRDSLTGTFQLSHLFNSTYRGTFPIDTTQIIIGDSILYQVYVRDAATISNVVVLPSSGYFGFMVSRANILIVNNDTARPPTISSPQLFYSALASKGYSLRTASFGQIPIGNLPKYNLVILSAGLNPTPFTIPTQRQAIIERVASGGKVLVEGGQVGWLYRKSGPFDAEPRFRRQVLHDSTWLDDVTNSDLLFVQPAHRIFTTPNVLSSPISFTTRSTSADRDAVEINPFDVGTVRIGSWSESPNSAALIVHMPSGNQHPLTTFFPFSVGSITDTNMAKQLIENTVANFFPDVGVTDIGDETFSIPQRFTLEQNYPNPFNPVTVIRYALPVSAKVNLRIYNILGQEVASLVNQEQKAGRYEVSFNGSKLASGVYFYKLEASSDYHYQSFITVRKMILLQ